MPYMTRIPSDLARFGLRVELVPGWETRGSSSFAPACVVDHWTAGPHGTTGRPSLNVVVNGRPGLSGPLCNVYLARNGMCVVVAAGRANHAGVGGFRGLVGNSAAYGIEAECGGDGDWTPEMLDAYPRLNAALLSGLGRDASWVCGHNEWAPTRKIDIRDIIAAVRAKTAVALANPGTLPPSEEDDMPSYMYTAVLNDQSQGGTGEMGMFAPGIWVPIQSISHLKAYRAHGLVGPDQLNLAPNWYGHYKAMHTVPGPSVDTGKLLAELADLVHEDDAERTATAVADEIDRRERERLGA